MVHAATEGGNTGNGAGRCVDAPSPNQTGCLSTEEFGARFKEAYRSLWLIAAGITRSAVVAEDVVQDAAVVALGKLDEFVPETNFGAWMAQIVRFTACNGLRTQRIRHVVSAEAGELERWAADRRPSGDSGQHNDSSGALSLNEEQFDDRVLHALGRVSDIERACLLLRTLGELGYPEISNLLDIPQGTAMSHVFRARRTLRHALTSHGEVDNLSRIAR